MIGKPRDTKDRGAGFKACSRRFAGQQSGAAGVEAAFILPLFLASMLFLVEFGRVLYAKVEFEYALNNATRLGMVQAKADTGAVTTAIRERFVLLKPEKLTQVTLSEVTNADSSKTATLSASYTVNFLLPVTSKRSLTLTRSVSFLRPH